MGTATVHRPTEAAALGSVSSQVAAQMPPSAERVADLLLDARATGDRHGAQLLDCLLDRLLAAA